MQVFASNPNTNPMMIPVRPELRMSLKNDAKNPTPINKAIINAIGYPIFPWPVKPIISENIIPSTNEIIIPNMDTIISFLKLMLSIIPSVEFSLPSIAFPQLEQNIASSSSNTSLQCGQCLTSSDISFSARRLTALREGLSRKELPYAKARALSLYTVFCSTREK